MEYFMRQLQEIGSHDSLFNCNLGNVQIVNEKRTGLNSTFNMFCQLCGKQFILKSSNNLKNTMDVNEELVAGIMSTGAGYTQLNTILCHINVPPMSVRLYQSTHDTICRWWKTTAQHCMTEAGKEEKDHAVSIGSIHDNGIPMIAVSGDACWSKRSYGTNYSASSGAGAIVGIHSKKVLYYGVKNKTCSVCSRAHTKGVEPAEHTCFQNFNGPCTAMEAAIITEGFKKSVEDHGLIYNQYVADGDSSTYASIRNAMPYEGVKVDKIECKNHLLRNYCKGLLSISNNNTYSIRCRKILKDNYLRIRWGVDGSVRYWIRQDIPLTQKIEKIKNDIINGPYHVFGDHSKCSSYFCTDEIKNNSENMVPELVIQGIFQQVEDLANRLSLFAYSFVCNETNNLAESFNARVAKFVGGKRVNFSQRGSYAARCAGAVISYNTGVLQSAVHQFIFGINASPEIIRLESLRQQMNIKRMKKNVKKKKVIRPTYNKDAHYGKQCQKVDMDETQYEEAKKDFLRTLQITDSEKDQLEKDTVLQSSSPLWLETRRKLLTASWFATVCKRRQNTNCAPLVKQILYRRDLKNVLSIKHGKTNEQTALRELENMLKLNISQCGFSIDKEFSFLGASPDGKCELGIVEVKCPSSAYGMDPEEAIKKDGEPIKLPENLESLPRAEHFAAQRHRWNTNEEIAAILISFDKHSEWQSKEVKIRPKSGSMLLYSRKKVRYRRDGYCWKKRKDGKTTREDHMKLKVQGTECIYGCYVHSAILPTFHRRCYWLLQNPDIVLVHYLNVPYPDDNKLATVAPSLALWADKKEWTKDELVSQLKPMFFSEDDPDINSDLEISTTETVEVIVGQLMEKQRAARAAALARQLECGCPDSTCNDSRNCAHPLRRIQAAKPPPSDHQVSSTTGPSPRPMSHPPRQYTRDHRPAPQSASPLLLSLGQIQGGGGLLILNGTSNGTQQNSSLVSPLSVTSFVCEEPRDRYRQQYKPTFVLKREIPDSQPSSCIQNSDIKFEIETREEKIEVDFDRKIKTEPRSRNQVTASAPATPSRYPDLVERLESKVLADNCDDTLVLLGTDGNLGSSGFFDETLELSHEDIQKTLSANMPTCELDRNGVRHNDTANVMVSGIDTMDFIDSCEVVASPTHGVDDNVFVNLDAFDMLGDFPELEVLDPSSMSTNPVTVGDKLPPAEDSNEKMQTECSGEGTLSITDYSPEWAYPEGGAKVLVAGPWTDTSDQYTVLFDNFPVPSILVQNGLLRCYCPAHEAGLAALQVARGGRVVSDTVVFEYKAGPALAPSSPASAPLPSLDLRRFSLLQRLQRLQGRLQMKIEPADDNSQMEDVQLYSHPKFEERLVSFCQTLSSRSSGTSEGFTTEPNEDSSTILHLAAALGYTKLTTVLLRWRQDDTSLALEKEVNLGARDSDNCTPLMVASAAGHVETAVVLARWSAGTRREAGARAAALAARRAGHAHLAALLDRIHPPSNDGVFLRPHSLSQKSRAGSLESNLVKRPSIDSGINMADAFRSSSSIDKSESSSSARWERSMSLPLDSDTSEDSLGDSKIGRRMDLALCETAPRRAASPLIDVEALSDHDNSRSPPHHAGEQDDRVFTLAEQIIAAMPERIKNESSSLLSGCGLDVGSGGGDDTLMVPLLDETTTFNSEFSFEFCDNTYRYCGGSTPCSSGSVSPGSAALSPPPPSPRSLANPPLCTTPSATLQEFLNATTHFSNLTLNDREQRELYSAAITIQKAYRQYRGRQLQRRAAAAAITIQNCYRRYKQFAYLKQMHAAATVIQRGYRALRARRMATTPIKRTYSQRRQNQAARKIQQFMRQSKIKLQSARAESVRVARRSPDVRQNSLQRITSTPPTPNRIVDYLAPESPMNVDEDLLLELLFKI